MVRPFILLCALPLLVSSAFASQEQYLNVSHFHLEAETGESFGRVIVTGNRNESGKIKKLSIQFLDLSIEVPENITAEIPKFANGIQLSAEHGYKMTGGRTVYVTFTRGAVVQLPTCKEQWVVAASEFNGAEWLDTELYCRSENKDDD